MSWVKKTVQHPHAQDTYKNRTCDVRSSTLLVGIWLNRADVFPGFGTYSFITDGVIVLSGGFAVTKLGTPIMGLTDRIKILAGLQ